MEGGHTAGRCSKQLKIVNNFCNDNAIGKKMDAIKWGTWPKVKINIFPTDSLKLFLTLPSTLALNVMGILF